MKVVKQKRCQNDTFFTLFVIIKCADLPVDFLKSSTVDELKLIHFFESLKNEDVGMESLNSTLNKRNNLIIIFENNEMLG